MFKSCKMLRKVLIDNFLIFKKNSKTQKIVTIKSQVEANFLYRDVSLKSKALIVNAFKSGYFEPVPFVMFYKSFNLYKK